MTVKFPHELPDGSAIVEVSLGGVESPSALADWLDGWLARNRTWTFFGVEISTDEIFVAPPQVESTGGDASILLRLRKARQKVWRDWLVLRLLPEFVSAFPGASVRGFRSHGD